nr:putative transposase [Ipomoea batatas]
MHLSYCGTKTGCVELLGITAYDLKTKYSMSKMHVPAEFDQLRNKSMVFKLNLKHEHIRNPAKPIPVLNVMHDEELEAQYCPSMESESGDEAISPSMQHDLRLKGMDKPQDEVGTGAIKRCLLDQFSSSQNLKKSKPVLTDAELQFQAEEHVATFFKLSFLNFHSE